MIFEVLGRPAYNYRRQAYNNFRLLNIGAVFLYILVVLVVLGAAIYHRSQTWIVLETGPYDYTVPNTATSHSSTNFKMRLTNQTEVTWQRLYMKNIDDCGQKTSWEAVCRNPAMAISTQFDPQTQRLTFVSPVYDKSFITPAAVNPATPKVLNTQQLIYNTFELPLLCNFTDFINGPEVCNGSYPNSYINMQNYGCNANTSVLNTVYVNMVCNGGLVAPVTPAFTPVTTFPTVVGCMQYLEKRASQFMNDSAITHCQTWANATPNVSGVLFIQERVERQSPIEITSLALTTGFTVLVLGILFLRSLNDQQRARAVKRAKQKKKQKAGFTPETGTTNLRNQEQKDSDDPNHTGRNSVTAPEEPAEPRRRRCDLNQPVFFTPDTHLDLLTETTNHRGVLFIGTFLISVGCILGYALTLYFLIQQDNYYNNLGLYDNKALHNTAIRPFQNTTDVGNYTSIFSDYYMKDYDACLKTIYQKGSECTDDNPIVANIVTEDTTQFRYRVTRSDSLGNPTLQRDYLGMRYNQTCGSDFLCPGSYLSQYFLNCKQYTYTCTDFVTFQTDFTMNASVIDRLSTCLAQQESKFPIETVCNWWTNGTETFVREYVTKLTPQQCASLGFQPIVTAASVTFFILGILNYFASKPKHLWFRTNMNKEMFFTPNASIIYQPSSSNNFYFLNMCTLVTLLFAAGVAAVAVWLFMDQTEYVANLGQYDDTATSLAALSSIDFVGWTSFNPRTPIRSGVKFIGTYMTNYTDCLYQASHQGVCNDPDNLLQLNAAFSQGGFTTLEMIANPSDPYRTTAIRYQDTSFPECKALNNTLFGINLNQTLWPNPNNYNLTAGICSLLLPPDWGVSDSIINYGQTCEFVNGKNYTYKGTKLQCVTMYGVVAPSPADVLTIDQALELKALGRNCTSRLEQATITKYDNAPLCEAALDSDGAPYFSRIFISKLSYVAIVTLALSLVSPFLSLSKLVMDYFHRWLFLHPKKEGEHEKEIPEGLQSLPSQKDYIMQQNSHALMIRTLSPTGGLHPSPQNRLHVPPSPIGMPVSKHTRLPPSTPTGTGGRTSTSDRSPLDRDPMMKRVVYRDADGQRLENPVVLHETEIEEEEPKEDGDSSDGETIELESMWPETIIHPPAQVE